MGTVEVGMAEVGMAKVGTAEVGMAEVGMAFAAQRPNAVQCSAAAKAAGSGSPHPPGRPKWEYCSSVGRCCSSPYWLRTLECATCEYPEYPREYSEYSAAAEAAQH